MASATDNLTAIEAGKPYLVKWNKPADYVPYDGTNSATSSDVVNPVFRGVTIASTTPSAVETNELAFRGIFSPASLDANDKSVLYLGAGNKLYYPSAAMTVGSCRAVFALNGLTAGEPNDQTTNSQMTNPVRTFKLNFGDESTGITTTNYTNDTNSDGAWFTLDGRKLSQKPSQHGIYIKNGKKVVIK